MRIFRPFLLISYFDAESVLIAIFLIVDEDEYFAESSSGGRCKLKSDRCTAVWTNLQLWVLDMHKVWSAGTHVEHSGCEIRVGICDLLVTTMATANRQSHFKRLANDCLFGHNIHQP